MGKKHNEAAIEAVYFKSTKLLPKKVVLRVRHQPKETIKLDTIKLTQLIEPIQPM